LYFSNSFSPAFHALCWVYNWLGNELTWLETGRELRRKNLPWELVNCLRSHVAQSSKTPSKWESYKVILWHPCSLSWYVRPTITKYHGLGDSDNRNLFVQKPEWSQSTRFWWRLCRLLSSCYILSWHSRRARENFYKSHCKL
jgi:hypothetical protein